MDTPASRQPPRATAPPTMVPPTARSGAIDRFLRLHAFELLIFAVLFVLLALCLAVAPLITNEAHQGSASPPSGVRLIL